MTAARIDLRVAETMIEVTTAREALTADTWTLPPFVIEHATTSLRARGFEVAAAAGGSRPEWPHEALRVASLVDRGDAGAVVAMGASAVQAAAFWARFTGRRLVLDAPPPDASDLVYVLAPEHFTLRALKRLAEQIRAAGRPAGVIPALRPAAAAWAATKRVVNLRAGFAPTDRLLLGPADPYPGRAWPGSELVLGDAVGAMAATRLQAEHDLLAILTHSNGLDAYLGPGAFFCAHPEPGRPRLGQGHAMLLPCFDGAGCNRGAGTFVSARALACRNFAFFACGGLLAGEATLDPLHSLAQDVLENSRVETFFSSTALFEGGSRILLECAEPFLREPSAGRAARRFVADLRRRDPEGGDTFFLVGDPDTPLAVMAPSAVHTVAADESSLTLRLALPGGSPVFVSAEAPPGLLEDGARPCLHYASTAAPGADRLRAATWVEGNEVRALVVSPEEPLSSLDVLISRPPAPALAERCRGILRELRFTKVYLDQAPGDAELARDATRAIRELEAELLATGAWERRWSEPGGAVDLRIFGLVQGGIDEHLRRAQDAILTWQEAFCRARGSQPHKNWGHLLAETSRTTEASGCPHCGHDRTTTEFTSPVDPELRRMSWTCLRCWHTGDLSPGAGQLSLHGPGRARAGEFVDLGVRVASTNDVSLTIAASFCFESFQPGGESPVLRVTPIVVKPGGNAEITGRLLVPEGTQPGRYVMSAHLGVNGGLNVLRLPVGIGPR